MKRTCLIILVAIAWTCTAHAAGTVSTTASVTNMPREGVVLTPEAYYFPAENANFLANPGFEVGALGQDLAVTGVNGTTGIYGNQSSSDSSSIWTGASCSVRVGTCSDNSNNYCWNTTNGASVAQGGCTGGGQLCNAGTTFTISAYNGSSGAGSVACAGHTVSKNQLFTCSGGCPKLVGPMVNATDTSACNADAIGCRVLHDPGPGINIWNANAGWFTNNSGVSFNTGTVYQGNSSMKLNTSGGTQTLVQTFDNLGGTYSPNTCTSHPEDMCTVDADCPGGDTCRTTQQQALHPVVGSNWQFSFYANTASASQSCTGSLSRTSGNSDFNHTFNLTGDGAWHQYTLSFTGQDTSGQIGALNFSLSCTGGGTIYLDNAFLGKTT